MHTTLAVNSGIGSSVGVFRDGRAVFCMEEERLNRTKNWLGIPKMAIQYILEKGIATAGKVDSIALVGDNYRLLDRKAFYAAYDRFFREAVKARGALGGVRARTDAMLNYHLITPASKIKRSREKGIGEDGQYLSGLGFSGDIMHRVNHHHCHASAAYYGLADSLDKKYLVFALDGGGDNCTSAVYSAHHGALALESSSHSFSIGNIYSAVTYFLGFTPHEHEYKLMGLAPYAKQEYAEKYRDYFKRFLDLTDGDTVFYNPEPVTYKTIFRRFLNDLTRDRFDNIAAGLQLFAEELLERWVSGNVKKHGIADILCGGGVFMNVKANQRLANLPNLESMNVFPSCGDESNIFGAAFHLQNQNGGPTVGCLENYTLGQDAEDDLIEATDQFRGKIEVEKNGDPNRFIAEQLLDGKVLARCTGAMEFGARALGNRSILADPRNLATVGRINRAIKNRDFWMPFAPAVLWEKNGDVLRVPVTLKKCGSPYMMFSFDTLDEAREGMACAIHQSDFTARIEGVTKERYPDLTDIISRFHQETGVPAILNTSFNLHGFPIVDNSYRALEVLLNSDLDLLVIGDRIIRKK